MDFSGERKYTCIYNYLPMQIHASISSKRLDHGLKKPCPQMSPPYMKGKVDLFLQKEKFAKRKSYCGQATETSPIMH